MINLELAKKKFLIVARDRFPPFRVDVTSLFSKYLSKSYSITWLMERDEKGLSEVISSQSEKFVIIGMRRLRFSVRFLGAHAREAIRILLGQYDVVQCRDTIVLAGVYSVLALLAQRPFVYWMSFPIELGYLEQAQRDFHGAHYILSFLRWTRGWLGRFCLYRIALPLAKHIFVQSDEMKKYVASCGIDPKKMTAVPMGIDLEAYSSDSIVEADDAFYKERKSIIYLGTASPVRKMEVVAEGVAQYLVNNGKMFFLVVGNQLPSERQLISSVFDRYGISDQLYFVQHLPLKAALGHVKRASVCIASCPADSVLLNMGTPTKLVEYVAMGARIVANHHPDQDLVARNCPSIVCCDFDVEGFKSAVTEAIDRGKPDLSESKIGIDWVEANRSYRLLAAHVEQAYETYVLGQQNL